MSCSGQLKRAAGKLKKTIYCLLRYLLARKKCPNLFTAVFIKLTASVENHIEVKKHLRRKRRSMKRKSLMCTIYILQIFIKLSLASPPDPFFPVAILFHLIALSLNAILEILYTSIILSVLYFTFC